jgi:hypothetical protein
MPDQAKRRKVSEIANGAGAEPVFPVRREQVWRRERFFSIAKRAGIRGVLHLCWSHKMQRPLSRSLAFLAVAAVGVEFFGGEVFPAVFAHFGAGLDAWFPGEFREDVVDVGWCYAEVFGDAPFCPSLFAEAGDEFFACLGGESGFFVPFFPVNSLTSHVIPPFVPIITLPTIHTRVCVSHFRNSPGVCISHTPSPRYRSTDSFDNVGRVADSLAVRRRRLRSASKRASPDSAALPVRLP